MKNISYQLRVLLPEINSLSLLMCRNVPTYLHLKTREGIILFRFSLYFVVLCFHLNTVS